MLTAYFEATKEFETILDFFRFGCSKAYEANVYCGHGTDDIQDDILALILGSLHLPYDIDLSMLRARVTLDEKKRLSSQLAKRIIQRIPVPYLTHEALFCDLSFYVDERVLIPRSPIAELIQQAFSVWINPEEVSAILDVCTGSGCIAIACCYAFPDAIVDAVDISKEALAVAEINRTKHQLAGQLTLIESDCLDALPTKKYDIIISNPPYVSDMEMASLPVEYQHEPALALRADNHGLALVEKILSQSIQYLSDHGIVIIEVGNSEEALANAYPEVPFFWVDFENGGQGVFVLTAKQIKQYFTKDMA